jgi:RNA polymerase sigma-70 factor (ECF subfamily)
MEAAEETRLLDRCRSGDLDAFDRLLGFHQDAVFRTALRLLGDNDEAFDLAQDVLLTAFRKIGQFRGESRFSTWLYRITVNLARNRWKSASRRPVALSIDSGGSSLDDGDDAPSALQVADTAPDPRNRAAGLEIVRSLEREIARLPEPFREVIVLRHVEGLAYEEIASILEANLGTIKSRLSRARELLREGLGPALDEYLKG